MLETKFLAQYTTKAGRITRCLDLSNVDFSLFQSERHSNECRCFVNIRLLDGCKACFDKSSPVFFCGKSS